MTADGGGHRSFTLLEAVKRHLGQPRQHLAWGLQGTREDGEDGVAGIGVA